MSEGPHESRVAVNGVELAVYEWPGEGRPVLFPMPTVSTGAAGGLWPQGYPGGG